LIIFFTTLHLQQIRPYKVIYVVRIITRWLLCVGRIRKIYRKKVTYFRFKCSYSNSLQEVHSQIGIFLSITMFLI